MHCLEWLSFSFSQDKCQCLFGFFSTQAATHRPLLSARTCHNLRRIKNKTNLESTTHDICTDGLGRDRSPTSFPPQPTLPPTKPSLPPTPPTLEPVTPPTLEPIAISSPTLEPIAVYPTFDPTPPTHSPIDLTPTPQLKQSFGKGESLSPNPSINPYLRVTSFPPSQNL